MEECPDLKTLRGYLTGGYAFNGSDADEIVAAMEENAKLKLQVEALQKEIAAARDIMSGNGDKKDPAYSGWYDRTREMDWDHLHPMKMAEDLSKPEKHERRGMVWKACPEHRHHEKKPFNWGPPPWHPCPNCEYRDITGSTEIGPETFTEKPKCARFGCGKPEDQHGDPEAKTCGVFMVKRDGQS
jgi:hypothetical protein